MKTESNKNPIGRPSTYTEEIAAEICQRMESGEQLTDICRSEHMPPVRTVYQWKQDDKEGFFARFARAREIQCDVLAEQCIKIADDSSKDSIVIEKKDKDGNVIHAYTIEDKEWTSRSKLQIETRFKLISKIAPQKYGDKVDITTAGEKIQGGSPEQLKEIAEFINKNSK